MSIFEPKKVQQFQLQTSDTLLLTGPQKIYGSHISRFSPCMVRFLDNIQRLLIFSNYIGRKFRKFLLDVLKSFGT